ncbi:hypothetical protein, partial [Ligilactobacillus ruminis]
EDYDCVGTRRTTREGEPPIRSFFARMFYKIINKISDTEIVDVARDFRIMTHQMVDAILEMSEYNRFSKGIFSWVGFNTKYLEYKNHERVAGKTSWNFWSLFKYSIDGIVNFSQFPLDIASFVGFISAFLSGCGILFIIIRYIVHGGDPTSGWAFLTAVSNGNCCALKSANIVNAPLPLIMAVPKIAAATTKEHNMHTNKFLSYFSLIKISP